jgi:hypothetical protein
MTPFCLTFNGPCSCIALVYGPKFTSKSSTTRSTDRQFVAAHLVPIVGLQVGLGLGLGLLRASGILVISTPSLTAALRQPDRPTDAMDALAGAAGAHFIAREWRQSEACPYGLDRDALAAGIF